jgi:hypothetical protein
MLLGGFQRLVPGEDSQSLAFIPCRFRSPLTRPIQRNIIVSGIIPPLHTKLRTTSSALWESLVEGPRFGGERVRPHTLTPKSGDPSQKFLKTHIFTNFVLLWLITDNQ